MALPFQAISRNLKERQHEGDTQRARYVSELGYPWSPVAATAFNSDTKRNALPLVNPIRARSGTE